ncbi:uncharacterized protein LOC131667441 isoform X2 [Phymastichus coffea]|uniref:uncharacterized protein LOC131667441 isoform X2 n=1 Tax=Phymastichus coffea TaxID=108790 RepID=UPI00273A8A51|nr:uncharacterized protein LOC131667441 isoform X2 [Phymastichus coffea]
MRLQEYSIMAMLHFTLFANVINRALIKTISSSVDLTILVDDDDDDKMADTSQQHQQEVTEPPQTNGVLDEGLTEEERSKMRPADIDADMKEMERRKRVEMMMNSRLFREELERIIETQMKDGSGPSGLLQQISEMMGHQGARFNTSVFKNSNCVVPINDIRGVESMGYAKGEKLLRCKLAAVFRLLDLYGWTQGVGGMITARLNQDQEHFLVNPYGLLYHEVTASSLVKADMQGGVVEQGTTNFGVQIAGYQLHSTIHAARPDIKCIVHIATPSVTAISSTKCGILPLGQESIVIGEVSAHHYISAGPLNSDEREKLARNFGPINKVMLLTNRGALCCGETVEEAFFNVYNTVLACETQLKLMPVGVDNLNLITDEARKAIYEASRKAPVPQTSSVAEPSPLAEKLEKRWRIGGTEFEALMRMLDNAGFRTGYIYRHPLVKSEPPRPRNDVEVPPAVSSLGYLLEEEELYKQGLWKGGRKGNDRTRWLNSPNVYQKVEILETGTPDPKKITKWVSDGSPTHSSTPVKIDGALQFVPKNTNPKEFKQLQQQIKDYRRADKISAGPQSHILEGVTWEEAKKMQDATISGTGEQVVLVGAASKGIIQRGFQHNAMVYKTPYAKNPFDAVTDQELDQYKKEIERKTKGDIYDESQSESEALSSFNISRATHESSTAKSPIQSPVSVTSETEEESRDEPKVLRIETKQVPAPSQPEVVLSDGVSGVSRLSSRSTNSIDDCWRWSDNYDDCVLETARAQELPRPMKPLITEVQKFSKAKQKLKKDFFENYENIISITSNSTSENNDINQKRESAAVKFGRHNINLPVENFENKKKSSTKCQNYRETETEINNIRYTKTADINFAEIVSLPVEYFSTEHTIYNINKRDGKTTGHILEKAENNIEKTTNFYNMKLNTLWDNQTNKNTFQRDNLQHKKEQSNNFESMKDNRDFDNYVNKLQFSNSYSNEEVNTDKTCSFFINDTSKINNNSIKSQNESILSTSEKSFNSTIKVMSPNSQNNDTTTNNQAYTVNNSVHFKNEFDVSGKYVDHYVNELQFDISNYSNDAALDKSTMKSHHNVSNHQDIQNKNIIMNYCNELEFSTGKSQKNITLDQSPVETFELEFNTKMQSLVNSYSTPLEDDTFEKNPLDVNLKLFLENQSDMDNHLSKESFENINAIVKTNVVCDNIFRSSNRESSDSNGNAWTSDSTNCYDDEIERPRKLRKFKSNLDFTFSETDKSSGDFSPVSTPRSSFFSDDELVMKRITRNDSISEVVSSIDANIKPTSKVFVDMLADTENSLKYNLDSQNMSLIYSITPQNDIGCSSQDTTITEDLLEDIEDREDIKNEKNNGDVNWINLTSTDKKKENTYETSELSKNSFLSNISYPGLDQRELSKSTYQDLQKSNDETFHRDMSTSVDQIIQELNDAEIHISAANFVDEIIFDIECLNLTRDSSSRYSNKEELNRFIKEKISSINFTRNLAKDLVNNLSYNETSTTSTAKERIPSTATIRMRTTARSRIVAKRT